MLNGRTGVDESLTEWLRALRNVLYTKTIVLYVDITDTRDMIVALDQERRRGARPSIIFKRGAIAIGHANQ